MTTDTWTLFIEEFSRHAHCPPHRVNIEAHKLTTPAFIAKHSPRAINQLAQSAARNYNAAHDAATPTIQGDLIP